MIEVIALVAVVFLFLLGAYAMEILSHIVSPVEQQKAAHKYPYEAPQEKEPVVGFHVTEGYADEEEEED